MRTVHVVVVALVVLFSGRVLADDLVDALRSSSGDTCLYALPGGMLHRPECPKRHPKASKLGVQAAARSALPLCASCFVQKFEFHYLFLRERLLWQRGQLMELDARLNRALERCGTVTQDVPDTVRDFIYDLYDESKAKKRDITTPAWVNKLSGMFGISTDQVKALLATLKTIDAIARVDEQVGEVDDQLKEVEEVLAAFKGK